MPLNRLRAAVVLRGLSLAGALSLVAILSAPAALATGPELPSCWREMEIEAKWLISNRQFVTMRDAFSKQSGIFDKYTLDVKWDGHTNQFIDQFYDNGSRSLSQARHTLRHRTRYGTTDGENWQEVQYKGTPCHIDATWFRLERGNCRVSDALGRDLCATEGLSPRDIIVGKAPDHPAIASLLLDHPAIDLSGMQQFLQVSTHRYRAQFLDESGRPVFRVTLDKVTRTADGRNRLSFEAEIEMIDDHATDESVWELMRLANKIEKEFSLGKSRQMLSKTGLDIQACPLAQQPASSVALCGND